MIKEKGVRFSMLDRDAGVQVASDDTRVKIKLSRPIKPAECKRLAEARQNGTKPSSRIEMFPYHKNKFLGRKKRGENFRQTPHPEIQRFKATSTAPTRAAKLTSSNTTPHPTQKHGTTEEARGFDGDFLPQCQGHNKATLTSERSAVPMKSLLDEELTVVPPSTTKCHDVRFHIMGFVSMIQNSVSFAACNPSYPPKPLGEINSEQATAKADVRQSISLGRSTSLPFFGQTQTEKESSVNIHRSPRSLNERAIMEVVSEEEEEAILQEALSSDLLSGAAMNFEEAFGLDSSNAQQPVQVEQREPRATRNVEPQVKKTEPQDEKKVEKQVEHKHKKATEEIPLDMSAQEINQVTSLVMDLTRETAKREVVSQPVRIVRVSSSRNDNWKKRLSSPKKTRTGLAGNLDTKKRANI